MSVVGGDRRVIVQAKGGIRDYKVTGVQTCALPIFHAGHHIFIIRKKYPHILQKTNIPTILPKAVLAIPSFIATRFDFQCMAITVYPMIIVIQSARSEERRVGNECRGRRPPRHCTSKRRHTRLQGDWSSDVCSSDLPCWPPHLHYQKKVSTYTTKNKYSYHSTQSSFSYTVFHSDKVRFPMHGYNSVPYDYRHTEC